MNVLGVDLSSRAIDLVLLAEDEPRATWTRLELCGGTAFERCRNVAEVMPQPGWYESNAVYLIAVEMPIAGSFRSAAAQFIIFGAVIASLPDHMPVWSVTPHHWKGALGIKLTAKPAWAEFDRVLSGIAIEGAVAPYASAALIPQDALDALGIAYYARETNARGVALALEGGGSVG